MAPPLTAAEQDMLVAWNQGGMRTHEIRDELVRLRRARGLNAPDDTTIRRFLRGRTHKRGAIETRGRKRTWSRSNVLKANQVRIDSVQRHPDRYTGWNDIRRRARLPAIHRTNVQRAFEREGIPVRFRRSREKP